MGSDQMTAHAVGRSRLRETSPHNRTPRRGLVVRRLVSVGIVAGVIALPTTPSFASPTSTHSTVDPLAGTTGPVVVDVNGNGYVAWDDPSAGGQADRVLFCKIPEGQTCTHKVTLALPGKSTDNVDGIVQPFPMLGAVPGVVYVVGPRYVRGDVVVWTSHNGGSNFSGGVVIPSPSYADGTDVGDVLRSPLIRSIDYFSIASTNIGLGYTFTGLGTIGARNPPLGFTFDTSGVAGPVAAATLGFSGQQTIEAFWADGDTPTVDYYWAPTSGVSGAPGPFEHGPTRVSDGVNVRLAGGPKGLFLLSEDGSRAGKSWRLNVRKWDGVNAYLRCTDVHRVGAERCARYERGWLWRGHHHWGALRRMASPRRQRRLCNGSLDLGERGHGVFGADIGRAHRRCIPGPSPIGGRRWPWVPHLSGWWGIAPR